MGHKAAVSLLVLLASCALAGAFLVAVSNNFLWNRHWTFKAHDGLRHATMFTLRLEPQVLRLSAGAVHVVQGNCLRCHADQFAMVRLADTAERKCWDCHANVHGEVHSLSASPDALRPPLPRAGF